jgi:hypothetical protein
MESKDFAVSGSRPPFSDYIRSVEAVEHLGEVVRQSFTVSFTVEDDEPGRRLLADIDAALCRAQSPAPAWTREAPKEEGFWWTRDDPETTPIVSEWSCNSWLDCGADTWNEDDTREHWPVRLEPPK